MSLTFDGTTDTGGAVLVLAQGSAPDTVYSVYKIGQGSTITVTPLRGHPDASLIYNGGVRADAETAVDNQLSNFGDS